LKKDFHPLIFHHGGSMVGIEILIKVAPEKRVEFLQAFELLSRNDLQERHRITLELFENIHEPNTFLWLEHWEKREAMHNNFQEKRCRSMLGAVEVLGQLVHKRSFFIEEDK
jgi:quinol monooxygenase YgiN